MTPERILGVSVMTIFILALGSVLFVTPLHPGTAIRTPQQTTPKTAESFKNECRRRSYGLSRGPGTALKAICWIERDLWSYSLRAVPRVADP
jgi:hypothetical protein